MKAVTPEHVGLSSTRLGRIRPVVERYLDEGKFAGVITLVARCGEIAHFECAGQLDLASGKPMPPDALFRIYSMTKPITSLALLMLYEEGRVRLSDPVARFIPAFKDLCVYAHPLTVGYATVPLQREITVHDLLTHTSGLSYGGFEDTPVDAMYRALDMKHTEHSLEELVAALVKLPLVSQPGTTWRYSLATDVVGRLVEIISGMTLDAFFEERIFEPLGMPDTFFNVPPAKLDRLATLYQYRPAAPLAPLVDPLGNPTLHRRLLSGGGGLISTAADYLRFAQMLLNGGVLDGVRLVSRKTVELMTLNHLPPELLPFGEYEPHRGYGFGLGVSVIMDLARYGSIGSVGTFEWGGAANTAFWVDPQEKLIGILLTQFMPAWHFRLTDDFRVLTYQAIDD